MVSANWGINIYVFLICLGFGGKNQQNKNDFVFWKLTLNENVSEFDRIDRHTDNHAHIHVKIF